LIGLREVASLAEKEQKCQEQLNKGNYNVGICFDLIDNIVDQSHGGKSNYKVSGYDVRKSESKNGARKFPPGHKVVETYLGGWKLPSDEGGSLSSDIYTQVLEAIHATSATEAKQRYLECTDPPYAALSGNDGKGVVDDVVQILQHPDNVQL
jgi:carboxypeptidase D